MFRQSSHVSSDRRFRFCVTVMDVVSVQRVLVMLTGRAHRITRLEAEEADGGLWRLSIDCTAGASEAELLQARLSRLPSVLTVDLNRGSTLTEAP